MYRSRTAITSMMSFFENSPALMAVIELIDNDTDGRFLLINPSAVKVVNKSKEELLSSSLLKAGLPTKVLNAWVGHFRESEKTKKAVHFEKDNCGPFGAHISCVVNHLEGNQFAFLAQDITAEKQLELERTSRQEELETLVKERTQALEKAMKLKNMFLAVMSHEIRTPLSGVIGTLSLLEDENFSPYVQEMLRTAKVCGEQLMAVINDILDLTKIEEDKLSLENKPFSLRTTIEDSIEIVSSLSEKQDVEVIMDVNEDTLDDIIGDPGRLKQILSNLLSNAVKFSPKKGEVVLSASSSTSVDLPENQCTINFSVSDNGCGIKQEMQKDIFQPFCQGNANSSRGSIGGSGLGLCISKRLAETMGGSMNFKSKEGTGTSFFFDIRVAKGTTQSSHPKEVPKKKYILVSIQNDTYQNCLCKNFRIWGFVPITCQQHIMGIFMDISATEFQVAVLDSNMDVDFIRNVEQLVPVVLLGYSLVKELNHLPFLRKPVRTCVLYKALFKPTSTFDVEEATEEKDETDCQNHLATIKVLVAEDHPTNQMILKQMLLKIGVNENQITVVENGKQAVNEALEGKFDLILMDIVMPVLGGLEAIGMIRKCDSLVQPYIIAVTANAFAEDQKQCLQCGANEVIVKPVTKSALYSAINNMTSSSLGKACLPESR